MNKRMFLRHLRNTWGNVNNVIVLYYRGIQTGFLYLDQLGVSGYKNNPNAMIEDIGITYHNGKETAIRTKPYYQVNTPFGSFIFDRYEIEERD